MWRVLAGVVAMVMVLTACSSSEDAGDPASGVVEEVAVSGGDSMRAHDDT